MFRDLFLRFIICMSMSSNQLLFEGIDSDDYSMVEYALDRGAKINGKKQNGEPLFSAISNSNIRIIDLLIKNGANINIKDSIGRTPLIYAVQNIRLEVVNLLLALGVDIDAQDNLGFSALMHGILGNRSEIVNVLLNLGANLSLQNMAGKSCFELINNASEDVKKVYNDFKFRVENQIMDSTPLIKDLAGMVAQYK